MLIFTSRGTGTNLIRTTTNGVTTFHFNTGHSFYRPHTTPGGTVTDLKLTGLSPDEVEEAVVQDIELFKKSGGVIPMLSPTFVRPLERGVTIDKFVVGYRCVEVTANIIAISTYFLR